MSQIDWAKINLNQTREAVKVLRAKHSKKKFKFFLCSHLEAKFIAFAILLLEDGHEVHLASNLPSSIKQEFIPFIETTKIFFYNTSNLSFVESEQIIQKIISQNEFDFIFDDGAHTYPKIQNVVNTICTEFTQSGINIASTINLKVPVVNLNSSFTKRIIGNVYGTGISTLAAIQMITNLSFFNCNVGIIGFGPIGLSCANSFKGAGANIYIYDNDPVKSRQISKYGFIPSTKNLLFSNCDLIITCTGQKGAINIIDFEYIKPNSIIGNVGHYNHEIIYSTDSKIQKISNNITEIKKDGKSIFLLCEGNLVNLAFGMGYPIQIIDFSFAAAVYAWAEFHGKNLENLIHTYPESLDLRYFGNEMMIYHNS